MDSVHSLLGIGLKTALCLKHSIFIVVIYFWREYMTLNILVYRGGELNFSKDISLLKKDSHEIVCFLLWFLVKQNIIKRNQNKNKINVELKALKRPVHGIFIPSCSVSRIYLKTEIFQQYNHTHTFWELSSIQVPNPLLFRLRNKFELPFFIFFRQWT